MNPHNPENRIPNYAAFSNRRLNIAQAKQVSHLLTADMGNLLMDVLDFSEEITYTITARHSVLFNHPTIRRFQSKMKDKKNQAEEQIQAIFLEKRRRQAGR